VVASIGWTLLWLALLYEHADIWVVGGYLLVQLGLFAALRRGIPGVPFLEGVIDDAMICAVVRTAFWTISFTALLLLQVETYSTAALACAFLIVFSLLAFAYSDSRLDDVLGAAGFADIEIHREHPDIFASGPKEEAEHACIMGPSGRLIDEKKPAAATLATIRREIEEAFAAHARNGGTALPSTVFLVTAHRPAQPGPCLGPDHAPPPGCRPSHHAPSQVGHPGDGDPSTTCRAVRSKCEARREHRCQHALRAILLQITRPCARHRAQRHTRHLRSGS